MSTRTASLEQRLLDGDRRALSRVLTAVENRSERGLAALRVLYPHSGNAHTIGLTGSPGAGKSTVTNALAKEYRRRGRSVGILAVDPSSPFTEGAILGDRVRMQELTADAGVFMRSLATRGALGGLADATADMILVLDAFGKDVILIETVGAGQDEVEIAATAQTSVLVNTPGMGDDIQTLKAGIMEIADVLAVNKADLPGAEMQISQLHALLSLSAKSDWEPPVLKLIATEDEGIAALADACDSHRRFLQDSGRMEANERDRVRRQLLGLARRRLLADLLDRPGGAQRLDAIVQAVATREIDPHTAVDQWLSAP